MSKYSTSEFQLRFASSPMKVFSVFIVTCFVLLFVKDGETASEKKIVCYYTGWSSGRPGDAAYNVDQVDPFLCTHIIYAFFTINITNRVIAPPSPETLDVIKKLTDLKGVNPNLKILVNTGGWGEGSERYSEIASEPTLRQEFAKNTVQFLRDHQLDGFEFGWLYPLTRDKGRPDDNVKYVLLIQETRRAAENEAKATGKPPVILSISFKPLVHYLNSSINVAEINKYVDIMNAITYDFHSVYAGVIGHPAHLYPIKEDVVVDPLKPSINADAAITNLLNSGANPEKITLGIPTFGRYFILADTSETDLGSDSAGPAPSKTVGEKGIKNYYEICVDNPTWTIKRVNATAVGPYAYKFDTWVAYDDEVIIREKAKYAIKRNLGGLNFWTIDDDDFLGKCNTGKYPLITAGKDILEAQETTMTPITTDTTKAVTLTSVVTEISTTVHLIITKPAAQKTKPPRVITSGTSPTQAPTSPTKFSTESRTKRPTRVTLPSTVDMNLIPRIDSVKPPENLESPLTIPPVNQLWQTALTPFTTLFGATFQNNTFFQDIKITNIFNFNVKSEK